MPFRYLAPVLLLVEVLIISTTFDAALITNAQMGTPALIIGQTGLLIQFLATMVGAYLVIAITGQVRKLHLPIANTSRGIAIGFGVNIVSFALFFAITLAMYSFAGLAGIQLWSVFAAWIILAMVVAISLATVIAPLPVWFNLFLEQKSTLAICAVLAAVVTGTSILSKNLWPSFIEPTFFASEKLLLMWSSSVISVPEKLYLGIDQFVVHVSSQCSGVEGIGLSVSFTILYLYLFRAQLKWPLALLLVPFAAACSWLLNVVRITVLIMLGEHISPAFAVGGFHSQAGWVTFIVLALLIVYGFNRIPGIKKANQAGALEPAESRESNLSAAILITFLIFLGGAIVSGFYQSQPNWLYPVKALGTLAAIVYFWRRFEIIKLSQTSLAVVSGLACAVVWVLLIPADPEFDQKMAAGLAGTPLYLAAAWVGIRLLGSILVAPVIEELVFRSYLLARITNTPLNHREPMAFNWLALVVSAVAFGAVHNQWLAGIVVGIVYYLVRQRGNITSAIVAHAVTNASLCVYALAFGQWSYL